jgi:hypothetical protein
MRYVAKIHVLDVMDQVVVSGYVVDSDHWTDPDHEVHEFTYSVMGLGLSDPYAWLLNALYRALVSEETPARGGSMTGVPSGGLHTISETGDRPISRSRWTVAGGAARGEVSGSRSDSDGI